MKLLFSISSALLFSTAVALGTPVDRPDIKVGSNWTYKKVDMYTGIVQSRHKNVVQGKTDALYNIVRYDMQGGTQGAILREYSLAKNLGQGSPVPSGKIGDGNLYMFPLKIGDSWKTRSYWSSGQQEGYDEVTYTVAGEEDIVVEAGTFSTLKITGSGWTKNITRGYSGRLTIVNYYSPTAQAPIRTEWTTAWGGQTPSRDAYELTSYELK